MLKITFTTDKVNSSAVIVLPLLENQTPDFSLLTSAEKTLVKKAMAQTDFTGKKETFLQVLGASYKIILAGLGTQPNHLDIQKEGGSLVSYLKSDNTANVIIPALKGLSMKPEDIAKNMAYGALLGSYRFDKYKSEIKKNESPKLTALTFHVANASSITKDFKNQAALAKAVYKARDLSNEPANHLTPKIFAQDIKNLSKSGLEIDILDINKLKAKHFDMLLSVAQGSINEPYVAVLKWMGNTRKKEFDLGLVGKGVTFDSGGISLKPGQGMGDMKQDMTGAAVVVSTLKAVADQKVPKNIIGIVGLVENMPSGSATRPGDIVTSMSGQTVEILNTDAEGRLVLGDCLWYMQTTYGVKKIIDIATLTGAVMHALGDEYAGLFSNDDTLAHQLIDAGLNTDEKVWHLPMNDAYNKLLDSPLADMKNIGGKLAGGSTAACFLGRFIKDGTTWAHLDIAGMDKEEKGRPLCPKGATGYGVRLLNDFILK